MEKHMSEKITIAVFDNKIITAKEYRKSIYKDIYCPYCDSSVKMCCVENSYFRAMPKN